MPITKPHKNSAKLYLGRITSGLSPDDLLYEVQPSSLHITGMDSVQTVQGPCNGLIARELWSSGQEMNGEKIVKWVLLMTHQRDLAVKALQSGACPSASLTWAVP